MTINFLARAARGTALCQVFLLLTLGFGAPAAARGVCTTPGIVHTADGRQGDPDPGSRLFDYLKPPVPILVEPADGIFVEGNAGQFLDAGTNSDFRPATFSWRPGTGPVLATWKGVSIPVLLGHTRHYEICVYQKDTRGDFGDQCDKRQAAAGWVVFTAACPATSYTPNAGGILKLEGFQNGLTIDMGSGMAATYPQVRELNWKMRACNAGGCSAWTSPRILTFVPPPKLVSFVTRNGSWPVRFRFGYVGATRAPGYRLCISAPSIWCPINPTRINFPLIRNGNFSGAPGTDVDVTIADRKDVEYHPGLTNETLAGKTSNWSAATCWTNKANKEACVYNAEIKSVTLPP